DRTTAEVGRVKEHALRVRRKREPLVHRTVATLGVVDLQHGSSPIDRWVPRRDGAVLGGKDEQGGLGRCEQKRLPARVPHGARGSGGRARRGARWRGNPHGEGHYVALAIVESGDAHAVIGDPERAAGERRNSPRVLEVPVGRPRLNGAVGY